MTIGVGQTDICPHCKTANRFEHVEDRLGHIATLNRLVGKNDFHYSLELCRCTNCSDIIIFFDEKMIYPLGATRPPCPTEVEITNKDIANDYKEACLVEQYSKKASAALARRCLQNTLHDQGVKKKDLNEEIDEAMTKLPSHLSEAIDAIRTIGNFAAHPIKYQNTGEIVDVEKGEAEWSLDVLEQLFDFYYVAPDKLKVKRDKLNKKLQAAGKPNLK